MSDYRMAIVPVTQFQQNCTLLWHTGTKRCVIVDPGGEVGRILDVVVQQELQVETILLTHGHLDHAGGAEATRGTINEDYGKRGWDLVPILGPDERDAFLLRGIEAQCRQIGSRRSCTRRRRSSRSCGSMWPHWRRARPWSLEARRQQRRRRRRRRR